VIGYNVSDSVAAIKSFKLHFSPSDLSPVLTIEDKAVLNNLLSKYSY